MKWLRYGMCVLMVLILATLAIPLALYLLTESKNWWQKSIIWQRDILKFITYVQLLCMPHLPKSTLIGLYIIKIPTKHC